MLGWSAGAVRHVPRVEAEAGSEGQRPARGHPASKPQARIQSPVAAQPRGSYLGGGLKVREIRLLSEALPGGGGSRFVLF